MAWAEVGPPGPPRPAKPAPEATRRGIHSGWDADYYHDNKDAKRAKAMGEQRSRADGSEDTFRDARFA